MYNILELSAKTLDQLKVIAAEMGIQKIDGIEQEDLVYKILDQQAIDMASKAAANPPAPKKRGPKPKKNPILLYIIHKIKRSLYLKNRMN